MLAPSFQVQNEDVREMLSDGWSVVGYSTMPIQMAGIQHSVLLQKGKELVSFNVTLAAGVLGAKVVTNVLSYTPEQMSPRPGSAP